MSASLQAPPATKLEFYTRTCDAWEAMYEECAKAEKSIGFEQYIVLNDEIGKRFLALFASKAKEGVAIHLLLDGIGSRSIVSSPLIKEIRQYGGIVNFYNPLRLLHIFAPSMWFPRNHTKTMLIDSRVAFIGRVCLADYMRDWRDLYARVTGELVQAIERDFTAIWSGKRRAPRPSLAGGAFSYVVAEARSLVNPIYRALLNEIGKAEKSIYLATPFFMPPLRLRHALHKAVKRGVQVKVMITEKTDVPLAALVSRSYFASFIRRGATIFSYQKASFHAKYAVIDDQWATMGSTNIDYLSLLRNREANILIRDKATIALLKQSFEADIADCITLGQDVWKNTPFILKVVGYFGRALKTMI